jgi:hypothetical protein
MDELVWMGVDSFRMATSLSRVLPLKAGLALRLETREVTPPVVRD